MSAVLTRRGAWRQTHTQGELHVKNWSYAATSHGTYQKLGEKPGVGPSSIEPLKGAGALLTT